MKKKKKMSFGEKLLTVIVIVVLMVGSSTIFNKVYDFVSWAVKLEGRISCLEKPSILCGKYDFFRI